MSPIPRVPGGSAALDTGANVIYSVAFSRDGHTLASGGDNGNVRLWDVADPAHPRLLGRSLTGGTGVVYSVAFSRDGHTLASGTYGGAAQLWNLNVGYAIDASALQPAASGLSSGTHTSPNCRTSHPAVQSTKASAARRIGHFADAAAATLRRALMMRGQSTGPAIEEAHMHPYISRGIAAERTRDMQARAARGRQARQVRSATTTRRAFHVARLWTRPSGRVTTLASRVPAERGRAAAQAVEELAGNQVHRGRAA